MGMNKRTALLSAAIVTFGLGTLYLGLNMKSPRPIKDPNSWDVLIFTQSWPTTECYTWKQLNASHTCYFPPKKDMWTIHGIWPEKFGTMGPNFCNKSLVYDPAAIHGIKDKLNQYWTDLFIEPTNNTAVNSSSITHKKETIWHHEWDKHGTCAVSLPALDSEFKYFNQGIEWSEKYNIKDILEKSGIKVNSTSLFVADYWKAIKSVLKTNVYVQCVTKHDTKDQLIEEIRMCFDKNLKLVDCDGIVKRTGILEQKKLRGTGKTTHALTNCDQKKPILFLDNFPEFNNTINSNSTNSNSTTNEHSKVLFRSKRKVLDHPNEWITKNPRHLNRSNSYQPRTNTTFVHSLNRSNSYPYIQRSEWDLLIFSQSWPYTFCHTWTVDSKTHTCNLPANRNQWTIHGIWPTKTGSFGPFYCNNQTSLRLETLNPVISELHNRWTEIKGSKTWSKKNEGDLWKHEWKKHGTCSQTLPALNSEFKYFKQALDWSKKYQLSDLLSQGGIKPNGTYPITKFWDTLRTGLGKNPRIDCYVEKNSFKVYIDEVRLCFDKTLSLVNCDTFRRNHEKPYTNCPLDKEITYLGAVV